MCFRRRINGVITRAAARITQNRRHAWGVHYSVMKRDGDADGITTDREEAERTHKPVAVLVGTESGA